MAKGNRPTSKQRALAVAEPPARPMHVLLAPNVEERLGGLAMHGVNAKSIAGLLRMCGESIYEELVAMATGEIELARLRVTVGSMRPMA